MHLAQLNFSLKEKLKLQYQQARQTLTECLEKRNQLTQRIEIQAHEHYNQVIPDRLGGFIQNEREIQRAKS